MLKFFRRIRRKLLDEGSLRKYLVYAIGEILLVMIGILLAFQVNTWNENKKREGLEIESYYGTIKNLNDVMTELKISIELNNIHSKRIDIVLNHIQNEKVFHPDSLRDAFEYFFYFATPHMNLGYWETIKIRGIDLFSNNELGQEISTIYEYRLTKFLEDYDKTYYIIFQEIGVHALYEFIDYNSGKPFDSVSLRKNIHFVSMLHRFKRDRKTHNRFLNVLLEDVRAVSIKIEQEIKRLEK